MRRVALLVALALGLLLAVEEPASAHGSGGIETTNYETTLDRVSPALPGVRVRVIEAGGRLELRNTGPEVVVLGYQDEAYLRVGPDGTFENLRSPTSSANRDGLADQRAAPRADPEPSPEWRRLSDEPVARWHDHRAHWGGHHDPSQVMARPGVRQVVQLWALTVRRGRDSALVSGQVTWVPPPSPAPWFAVMAMVFLGVAALGRVRRWGPPLAAVAGVLLAVDLLHAIAAVSTSAGGLGSHLARVVTGSFYSIVGWVLAAVAARLLARHRVDGLFAGVFAGLSVAVFGGLLDIATLSRSITPFALPIAVARLCVALAIGGGLGLAAACLLVIRRTPAARRVLGGQDEGDGDEDSNGHEGQDGQEGGTVAGGRATSADHEVLGVGARGRAR